jgi:hypothetical protein
VVGIHHGVPHPLHRRVDLDLRVDRAHVAADTNDRGRREGRPVLSGAPGRRAARRPTVRTRTRVGGASSKLRNLRQLYRRLRKFPLFAGISPNVNFLRFPEFVVARGGRSRV